MNESISRRNSEIKSREMRFNNELFDIYNKIDALDIDDSESIKNILKEGLDIDEAEYFIEQMYNKGLRPYISTPLEKKDLKIQEGFTAKTGWDPSVAVIAGTLGIDVYGGEVNKERVSFKINIDSSRIHPRMTGQNNLFYGVVILDGPVTDNEIEYRGTLH